MKELLLYFRKTITIILIMRNPLVRKIRGIAKESEGYTVYWRSGNHTRVMPDGVCLAFWPDDHDYHPVGDLHRRACLTAIRSNERKNKSN